MKARASALLTILALLTAVLIVSVPVSAQSAKQNNDKAPMKMRSTTAAQRKAAAAHAAARRAKAALQQQKMGVPVGVPGGGALTRDQLYFGNYPNYANSPIANPSDPACAAPNYCGIRKFVDTLPGLNAPNDLGQMIPVAVPDTVTFPGSDYYEIAVEQFAEKMHADLPPTLLRGYVQLNYGTDANGQNTIAPAAIHYLGPLIIARSNRPVRVKFTNLLPSGPPDPTTGKTPATCSSRWTRR